jgi:pimeloyl-ACP methyl ester carboxylesterase
MLIGDKDNLFSKKQAKKVKEYIPHAEFEVIEGGGHGMVYECGEVIARRIEAFQESHCPRTDR